MRRSLRAAILLLSLLSLKARAPLVSEDRLPLQSSSRWIVDRFGKRVKWACVNWSGAAQKDGVAGGLQHQSAANIASRFRDYGFNCVRIPWSVQMVLEPHSVSNQTLLAANPRLLGKSTLEILDSVVDACANARLLVILDNHMSDADWCCSETDENGLWYNDRWSEAQWIEAHTQLAKRYQQQPYVVAAELRNELRGSVIGGRKVNPTWASGDAASDWRGAAVRASTAILDANPSLLIVVDSLSYSTDFTGVYNNPIKLPVSGRLVYSAHDYSWSQQKSSQNALHEYLGDRWGYLLAQNKSYTAPVWVSEFGTSHNQFAEPWWTWFSAYLSNADIDWGYWRGDGTESRGTGRTFGGPALFGVLNATWSGPSGDGSLLRALQDLQNQTQGPTGA